MATSKITKKITDIIYLSNRSSTTFSMLAGAAVNVVSNGYVTKPEPPDGYEIIMYGVFVSGGNAEVLPVGMNNDWVINLNTTAVSGLVASSWVLAVKY